MLTRLRRARKKLLLGNESAPLSTPQKRWQSSPYVNNRIHVDNEIMTSKEINGHRRQKSQQRGERNSLAGTTTGPKDTCWGAASTTTRELGIDSSDGEERHDDDDDQHRKGSNETLSGGVSAVTNSALLHLFRADDRFRTLHRQHGAPSFVSEDIDLHAKGDPFLALCRTITYQQLQVRHLCI